MHKSTKNPIGILIVPGYKKYRPYGTSSLNYEFFLPIYRPAGAVTAPLEAEYWQKIEVPIISLKITYF